MEETDTNLYDVIFYWNAGENTKGCKQYCAETLCNILGFTPSLSVKLIYDSIKSGHTLLLTTRNIEKATIVRDTLLSMNLKCEICAYDVFKNSKGIK